MYAVKLLAKSIGDTEVELTSLQLQYPRFIHSEFMTHRVFSRNAASSRAIPVSKLIDQVVENPATPIHWGKNQSGMQAREELEPHIQTLAMKEWLSARDSAVAHAKKLADLGVHKQVTNRILEPFQWMQTIVTATDWDNFYALRRHKDAQPEIKYLADLMFTAMDGVEPKYIEQGGYHLPYIDLDAPENDEEWETLLKRSTARCARVSYLNHDKSNPDPKKDEKLHDMLLSSGHFSPFEHQATPADDCKYFANFRGWRSYRYEIEHALSFSETKKRERKY